MNQSDRRNNIRTGLEDTLYIWWNEFKKVFHDSGVMIFFFLVPFGYPLLYSFIYNNETVREVKIAVVDKSDSRISREFIRRVNASHDVQVIGVVGDEAEAKKMMDEKKTYGYILFPERFSKDLQLGRQSTVLIYADMSAILYYKAIYKTTVDVSFDMNKEIVMRRMPQGSRELDRINVDPLPGEWITMFNSQNGFASFLVPGILIVIIQQTLLLGIGLMGGTSREQNRFHCLVPINRHYKGTLRIVLGKGLTYLVLYAAICLWVFVAVPEIFSLPQVGQPQDIALFLLPFLSACIFLGMTLSGIMRQREEPIIVIVFSSVILVFISGLSWPNSAIPPFWKALGYLFPSTPGIQGYVRMSTDGALLNQVANEYRTLWVQSGVYFFTACLTYRYQIIRSRQLMLKQYRIMKAHLTRLPGSAKA